MKFENTLQFARKMDRQDPLKSFRSKFLIPKVNGKTSLYFTGNSLGLQPKSTRKFLTEELNDWAALGVEGHLHARRPWLYYHKFGRKALADIVGAKPSEVVAMNQLTVNLHLMLVSFYKPTAQRFKILTERGAFSSDQYAFETQLAFHKQNTAEALVELAPRDGEHTLRTDDILAAIKEHGPSLALVIFGGVQYYTGQFFDIKKITQAGHDAGAYVGFDLAHAAGNVDLALHKHNVDFAVWCGYKYLNSGPGAIAGAFVHERHARNFDGPRFGGWWGHSEKERFEMKKGFLPMPGVDGWQVSNVPIFQSAAHLASLEIFEQAGMKNIRAKSMLLTGYLEFLLTGMDQYGKDFVILTPSNPKERGAQLSLYIANNGKKVFKKITAAGVIADWREPDVIRVAPVALYNTFEDVYSFATLFQRAWGEIKNNHIAIAGAGLVGSLLAIYLARRGYKVSVFERRPDMRLKNVDAGRSINLALSTRGIAALEEVDMASDLRRVAIPMHGRVMHALDGKLTFQPYGKQGQYINSISRSGLNEVLINKAESHGAMFYFNQRIVQADLDQTKLTFQQNGTTTTQAFDRVIGADGAFSAVRMAMQFTDRFDFAQDYIDHGYKELHIPAAPGGNFALEKNALHIWPRESFMMIALPNPDGTFTVTLFFPFEGNPSFDTLRSSEQLDEFFKKTFPDAYNLMPSLATDFAMNPTSSLVTMKCYPWVRNKTLLIGDAAHAIVPFYGQGMNAGFEDCRILNNLLNEHHDDWDAVLPLFQQQRKHDTDAIAQLALDNFIEMRDLVADADFLLRKKIEAKLHELYPDKWIPLYSMVTFHDNIRYSDAYATGLKQKKVMDEVMKTPNLSATWQTLNFEQLVRRIAAD